MTWKEYVLNLLLFLAIITIIFTGLMISETVMPLLGITVTQNGLWRGVHSAAANVFILLVALHVGLHWQWFVNLLRRSRGTPETGRRTF
jgi:hypothetical protein